MDNFLSIIEKYKNAPGLTYDQEHLDINARVVSELHAIFVALIRLTITKVDHPVMIIINPVALTIIMSAATGARTRYIDTAIATDINGYLGSMDSVPVTIDASLGTEYPTYVIGQNDSVEVVHIKDYSFV